jgi:hypothetical protein
MGAGALPAQTADSRWDEAWAAGQRLGIHIAVQFSEERAQN